MPSFFKIVVLINHTVNCIYNKILHYQEGFSCDVCEDDGVTPRFQSVVNQEVFSDRRERAQVFCGHISPRMSANIFFLFIFSSSSFLSLSLSLFFFCSFCFLRQT
ncbi:hypothetical protein P5V15_013653 [Pogonomyrmex californicus]